MRLHEYQSKELIRRYGILTPYGKIANTPGEVYDIACEIGASVVVKAQVLTGGRGKAGGIKIAGFPEEAKEYASKILGMNIKGFTVENVLVEEAIESSKEYYLGITIDRSQKSIVVMACNEGGVDIEEVAIKAPSRIAKMWTTPKDGFLPWQGRTLALVAEFEKDILPQVGEYFVFLFRLFIEEDAELAEINPLMVTKDKNIIAADAKISLDRNAFFRRSKNIVFQDEQGGAMLESEAKKRALTYVKLNGDIGVIGNGAGLVMATIDAIKSEGGEAANFLDIGGGAKAETVKNAIEFILMDKSIKAILINVFGGITRCDEVAKGLIKAIGDIKPNLPIVLRLAGTKEKEGQTLLMDSSLIIADTMADAARRVVALAKGGGGA